MTTPNQPQTCATQIVETDIPARLDALPWGSFHTLVVVALGITWILDGLEVTLAGAVSPALTHSPSLHLTVGQVGLAASAYLVGAVPGALGCRWLTELLGRKRRVHGARAPEGPPIRLRMRGRPTSFVDLGVSLFRHYPRRAILGLVLMIAQAFCYNAIFFTYALVLDRFYGVPADKVGFYLLPFAVGNFLGAVVLGTLFDTWGRRPMIALTYAVAGALLALTALLFVQGVLGAITQTILWSIVFFFASAAASSAYLTVSESFPVEVRALAIALFYALGTGIGGVGAPWLFGMLI